MQQQLELAEANKIPRVMPRPMFPVVPVRPLFVNSTLYIIMFVIPYAKILFYRLVIVSK